MTITTAARPRRRRAAGIPTTRRRRVEGIYYAFLLPSLLLFTLAITLPAIIGIFFSFTDSIGFGDWRFIGFTNYVRRCSATRRSGRATCSRSASPRSP